MNNNISLLLKKYSIPVMFFILGISMLIIGVSSNQTGVYYFSSLLVLLAGLLSMAFSGGFLKTNLGKMIGYVAGLAAIITIYMSYKSVGDTSKHNELYKFSLELVKENLNNIRTAQKMYKEINGKYAPSWEVLEDFIQNGTVPEVVAKGFVPARKLTPEESKFIYKDNRPIDNNMTEEEAYKLSKYPNLYPEFKDFRRDTVQVSFFEKQFNNKTYKERRQKANFGKFIVDSLKYIPYTNGKEMFTLQTLDSVAVGSEKVPVIEVKGKLPFAEIHGSKKREKISFGSLTLPDLTGSWE